MLHLLGKLRQTILQKPARKLCAIAVGCTPPPFNDPLHYYSGNCANFHPVCGLSFLGPPPKKKSFAFGFPLTSTPKGYLLEKGLLLQKSSHRTTQCQALSVVRSMALQNGQAQAEEPDIGLGRVLGSSHFQHPPLPVVQLRALG